MFCFSNTQFSPAEMPHWCMHGFSLSFISVLARAVETYRLIVHSFVTSISFLINFTSGIQQSIYVLYFKTLDKFRRSRLVSAVTIWNDLPTNVILQGETLGWRTGILKDTQRCICN